MFRKALLSSAILFFCFLGVILLFRQNNQAQTNSLKSADAARTADFKWTLWNSSETKLRGANIWQRLVRKDDGGSMGNGYIGPPYDLENDFQKLKDWGANYVHISHPGIFSEKTNKGEYSFDAKSLVNLRSLVEACGRKGLFVVIAFRTGPERNEKEVFDDNKVSGLWKSPKAQKAWEAMWRKTAEEFKDAPNVVGYDLMVEPELKIGDLDEPKERRKAVEKAKQWSGFASQLITAIRDDRIGAGDHDTPILIGGIGMSDVNGLYLLDTNAIDPERNRKIVYAVHQYEPTGYAQQTEGKWSFDCATKKDLKGAPKPGQYQSYRDYENNPKLKSETLPIIYGRIKDWRRARETADYKPAIAITEFGVIRWAGANAPDAKDYLAKQFTEINTLKVNYAIWKWDSSFCTGDDDYNFRHGEKFSDHVDNDGNPLALLIRSEWKAINQPIRP